MSTAPVFVTRKFPPSVGGMETLAADIWDLLESSNPRARLVANGRSNGHLVWWLPFAAARVIWLALRRRGDYVLTGDALTYTALRPVLRLLRLPHATLVMGLDITFSNRAYRRYAHRALRGAPLVVAISAATASSARAAGVPDERIRVVRLAVSAPEVTSRSKLDARVRLGSWVRVSGDSVVLLTLGRLVPRKGVRWFVEEVLPMLPPHVHYVVAGEGPDSDAIADSASARDMQARVHLLGLVDGEMRETLLQGADVFVQPNIPVPGDMEGFGLVAIEAGVRDTPVVAADLEGLKDAVVDGKTGYLLPPGAPTQWIERMLSVVADMEQLQRIGREFGAATRGRYNKVALGTELAAVLRLSE